MVDVATLLNSILNAGQIYRLTTMIRNGPAEATLGMLADALGKLM